MKSDLIADGEAMSAVEGSNFSKLLAVIAHSDDDAAETLAFREYQRCWRANEEHPTLFRAAELVAAWNKLADLCSLHSIDTSSGGGAQ